MQVGRTGDGMGKTRGRRRLVGVIGFASALLAVAWLVAAFDTGGSQGSPGTSSGLAVAIPVIVLVVIAGVTWFLLTKEPDADGIAPDYIECASCGRSILSEWRLCPYCGARTEPSPETAGVARTAP
jgi:H+/Cl- antiporter ClcA